MVDELNKGTQPDIVNPGELLRSERERVGFSAEEVAKLLHLSRNALGYLEAGRFDRLPGDTFTRGYIRSYARLLKLDPNVFAGYHDRYVGADSRDLRVASINRNLPARRETRWLMALSTALIVAAMLALGLWWWSDSRDAGLPPEDSDVSALLDDVQVDAMALPEDFTSSSGAEPEEVSDAVTDPEQTELPEAAEQATAEEAPLAEAETEAEAQPTATESALPAESASTQAVSGKGLVMTFTGNCWVQVSLPGGRVLHSAQMEQGQTLNIDREGPLDLVIGAAEAVSTIEYNGQPVELIANRQSGVARLRLGQ